MLTAQSTERPANFRDQQVTELVAVKIVDLLETIKVNENHRQITLLATRRTSNLLKAGKQGAPVGQAAQGIGEGNAPVFVTQLLCLKMSLAQNKP
jgi:CTP-dependent riboflavin kinase